MVTYEQYVAGWFDSSIHDFLVTLPSRLDSMRYALITCLDSNLEPAPLLRETPEFRAFAPEARSLRSGLLLPTRALLEVVSRSQLFFGFDEVWFFPEEIDKPKPDSAWLVGPARIEQEKLNKLGAWMTNTACALGLGDGEGLNFIIKARGLVKHLLGHSLEQPPPRAVFAVSSAGEVAG
jgi:hypothetical protein